MKAISLILFMIIILTSQSGFSQYNSPESVTYDSVGKRYFISNTASRKIVQRDINGVVTDFVTVTGAIHGVTVYNNKIYVCNGTIIRGYDLTTSAEVFNVTVSGSSFLNDLAIDISGMMYISDFNGRRIYKLNTNTSEYWIYVPSTSNQPNGVYVDAARNRLLICCWGANAPVKSVSFSDSAITNIITTPYSNCDGISLDRNDNVYISTWGIQSVVKYDINFANPPVIVTGGLSNPADIYVNKLSDTLAVPNASGNTVTFYYLNNPSVINQISSVIPNTFKLDQNYPNPFNPFTNINYSIPDVQYTILKVYDILGNEVALLVNEKQNPGSYSVSFDGNKSASGIYFYKLEAGSFSAVRKMMLIK